MASHVSDDYQSRCRQQVLRLRILASSRDGTALPREFTVEVRDATNAVIAEAGANLTALRASGQQEPQAETFLWERIARLAAEAERAVDAARSRDVPGLRAHLQQFDTLTSALWAVQHATYDKQPGSSPGRDSNLRCSGQGHGHEQRRSRLLPQQQARPDGTRPRLAARACRGSSQAYTALRRPMPPWTGRRGRLGCAARNCTWCWLATPPSPAGHHMRTLAAGLRRLP